MKTPDFFIAGAPRCGTTAMHSWMRQHPEVFMPEKKDVHYFGSDPNLNSEYKSPSQYLELFKGAEKARRAGEASCWYMHSRDAHKQIKDFSPEAQIIIMLRNPVDMIHSLHAKLLNIGYETIYEFEKALEAEDERKRILEERHGGPLLMSFFYRENARLSPHLEKWFATFGRENVLVIIYDDFEKGPASELSRAFRFLEVDPGFTPSLEPVNRNVRIRSRTLDGLLRRPPGFVKSLRKALVPPGVLPGKLLMRINTTPGPRPPMDPRLRRTLQAELEDEVKKLSDLLQRDLTHWTRE